MTNLSKLGGLTGSRNSKSLQNLDKLNKLGKVNSENTKVNADKATKEVHLAEFATNDEASYAIETVNQQKLTFIDSKINELTQKKGEIQKKLDDMPKTNSGLFGTVRKQLNEKLNDLENQIKQYENMKTDKSSSDKHVKELESRKAKLEEFQKKLPMGLGHQFDDEIKKIDEELKAFKD